MFSFLLKSRYIAIVIVLFSFLNSIGLITLGVIRSLEAYRHIIRGELGEEYRPGVELLESMDVFLVALVFLIFTFGIAELFIFRIGKDDRSSRNLPKWLHIDNFLDLKLILWEAIIITLVVTFLTFLIVVEHMTWTVLIIPLSILLLTVSWYIMKKG